MFNPLQLTADAVRGPDDTPPGSPARGRSGAEPGRPHLAVYPPIVRQLAALWMYKANIRGAQDARTLIVQRQLAALREGLLAQEVPERTVDRVKTYLSGAHGIAYVARASALLLLFLPSWPLPHAHVRHRKHEWAG